MFFFINSIKYRIDIPSTHSTSKLSIFQVLNYFGYATTTNVIEYNGIIIADKKVKRLVLKDNDRLEVISIVGGG